MRFLKGFIPNITMALAVSMLVILYIDKRNPLMGFLSSKQGTILIIATCVFALATALVLYISWRDENKQKTGKDE